MEEEFRMAMTEDPLSETGRGKVPAHLAGQREEYAEVRATLLFARELWLDA
jgi:hypothetical protein